MLLREAEENSTNNNKLLKKYRIQVFALTFLTYSAIYSTRTSWSYNKKQLQEQIKIPNDILGTIDMAFLLAYALSLNMVGKFDISYKKKDQEQEQEYPKKNKQCLSVSVKTLLLSGIIPASMFFITIALLSFYYDGLSYWHIGVLMVIYGTCQAPAWPSLVNIFGNWFKKGNRGLLMGIWACNSNIGNIIGLQIGHMTIVTFQLGWEYCFIISSLFLFSMGVINYIFLKPYPQKLGIQIDEGNDDVSDSKKLKDLKKSASNEQNDQKASQITIATSSSSTQAQNGEFIPSEEIKPRSSSKIQIEDDSSDSEENLESTNYVNKLIINLDSNQTVEYSRTLSYYETLSIPGVAIYTMSYACLKSTTYGLLFWLPKYLDDNSLQSYAASISQMLQFGTLLGGILTGSISDKIGKRAIVMSPMIFIAALMMYIAKAYLSSDTIFLYYTVIFLIGICLGGPYTICCSAVSIDLSEQPQVKGNKSALITISSLIEGTGAFCAAILQRVIPIVGQANIFTLFLALCLLAGLLLATIARKDLQEILQKRRHVHLQ